MAGQWCCCPRASYSVIDWCLQDLRCPPVTSQGRCRWWACRGCRGSCSRGWAWWGCRASRASGSPSWARWRGWRQARCPGECQCRLRPSLLTRWRCSAASRDQDLPYPCMPLLSVVLPRAAPPQQLTAVPCCRFPYGVGMVAAQPGHPAAGPVQYTGQPTGPGGQPGTAQPRPLFPSAAGAGTSSPSPGPGKATFPAYEENKKPQLIATTGSSSKIIHPPEDISLVSTNCKLQEIDRSITYTAHRRRR